MSKNIPIPKNEKERLVALKSYNIMDTLPEEVYSNITELASIICGTPIALISLLDENRQWFKADVGLGATETPRDISFCQHAIMENEIFEVDNALENSTFSSNPLVTGDPNIRFYAGTPLTDEDGYNLGTLCVIHTEPKKLTSEQKKALALLGKEVISQLSTRRRAIEFKGIKAYFDKAKDMICIAGQDGFFKKVNPRFLEVLGYSEAELLSNPFADYIHKDDLEATFKVVEQLAKGVPIIEFSNRYLCKDGSYKLFSWNAGVEIETGNMFAMARDITESANNLKRVEVESEIIGIITQNKPVVETLENIMGTICQFLNWKVACIWSTDEYKQTLINPKIKNFSKEKIEEFIEDTENITFDIGIGLPGRVLKAGKSAWVLDVTKDKNFPRAKSADVNNLHAGFSFPIKIGEDIPYVIEFFSDEILNANEELLRVFDEIGVLIGTFIQNKRIEKQLIDYQFSIDQSSIVATTDNKGKITYVNELFCEISGYSTKELIGKDHRIINSRIHSKEFMKDLWTTIEGGGYGKEKLKIKPKMALFIG